jgi:hypothetical protein
MECDACGRYMPSAKVLPVLDREGGVLMACPDCRLDDRPGQPSPSAVIPALSLARTIPAVPAGS